MPNARLLPALGLLLTVAASLPAAQPSPKAITFFEKEVRPLLVQKCQKCHGPKKQESGLRLDSRTALLMGGERGPAIVPGKADQSNFIVAIRYQGDLKMPPGGKLPEAQIAALTKWVVDGAVWPDEKSAAATRGGAITPEERRHWSLQPVTDPPAPAVRDAARPLAEVDRFVLARLEAQGLKPVRSADK